MRLFYGLLFLLYQVNGAYGLCNFAGFMMKDQRSLGDKCVIPTIPDPATFCSFNACGLKAVEGIIQTYGCDLGNITLAFNIFTTSQIVGAKFPAECMVGNERFSHFDKEMKQFDSHRKEYLAELIDFLITGPTTTMVASTVFSLLPFGIAVIRLVLC